MGAVVFLAHLDALDVPKESYDVQNDFVKLYGVRRVPLFDRS